MPIYRLRLEKTYYSNGYFNVSVDFDRFVRQTEGKIELVIGSSRQKVDGKLSRSANKNGTPRISGGAKLKKWFQDHHQIGDIVNVDLSLTNSIVIS